MKQHKRLIINSVVFVTVVIVCIELLDLFKTIKMNPYLAHFNSDFALVMIGTSFYLHNKSKFALIIMIVGLCGCALALMELLL